MQVLAQRDLGERDGFHLVAYKVVDEDATPEDSGFYEEADLKAYHAGNWSYVGVIVKAYREGIELGEHSIWGCADGYSPGWEHGAHPDGWVDAFDHTLGHYYDVAADAIEEAKKTLATLQPMQEKAATRWPKRIRVTSW